MVLLAQTWPARRGQPLPGPECPVRAPAAQAGPREALTRPCSCAGLTQVAKHSAFSEAASGVLREGDYRKCETEDDLGKWPRRRDSSRTRPSIPPLALRCRKTDLAVTDPCREP